MSFEGKREEELTKFYENYKHWISGIMRRRLTACLVEDAVSQAFLIYCQRYDQVARGDLKGILIKHVIQEAMEDIVYQYRPFAEIPVADPTGTEFQEDEDHA